jgi:hypothetical protein
MSALQVERGREPRVLIGLAVVGLMIQAVSPALAGELGWSDAVTQLAGERHKAILCVSALKKQADGEAIAKGERAYSTAKTDMDTVLTGLSQALDRQDQAVKLDDLKAAAEQGVTDRISFCGMVKELLARKPGDKNVFNDAMENTIGPVMKALISIVDHRSDDEDVRGTIQTQLEGARWPDFSKIAAAD